MKTCNCLHSHVCPHALAAMVARRQGEVPRIDQKSSLVSRATRLVLKLALG